jgi:hypothetical protein
MQEQTAFPFYDCAEDATNSAILNSGKSYKEVAHYIRPEISMDSAYAWLKNALKDDARETLSADRHIMIANYCQRFDFLYYVAGKCHHSRPLPVEPEDEKAELQRQFIKAVTELRQLSSRINGAVA